GYAIEPVYLRTYRRAPVLTFSESTRTDLVRLGFRGEIIVVPPGIESFDVPVTAKGPDPTFIYVGRIAPSKRVHDILEAFAMFRHEQRRGRLLLIGTGPMRYVNRMDRLAFRLGVSECYVQCCWLRGYETRLSMAD